MRGIATHLLILSLLLAAESRAEDLVPTEEVPPEVISEDVGKDAADDPQLEQPEGSITVDRPPGDNEGESKDADSLPDKGDIDPVESGLLPPRDGLPPVDPLPDWYTDPDFYGDLAEEPSATETELFITGNESQSGNFGSRIFRSELLPFPSGGPMEREGFRLNGGAQLVYDSNIFLRDSDEVGDLSLNISPMLEYRSAPPGVPGQIAVHYAPFIRLYLDESDLNALDHSFGGKISYEGVKGSARLSGNYGLFSNSDRFVGGLVRTESAGAVLDSSYQLTPRTSLDASVSVSVSEEEGRDEGKAALPSKSRSETFRAEIGSFWRATEKSSIGPAFRYTRTSARMNPSREAAAFLVRGKTRPRDNLSLSADAGLEWNKVGRSGGYDLSPTVGVGIKYAPQKRFQLNAALSYEAISSSNEDSFGRSGGGGDGFTGFLAFDYLPNPEYTFRLHVEAESFPSADSSNYSINNQTFGGSISRSFPSGDLTLDASVSFSDYDADGPVTAPRKDETFHSVGLFYQHPIPSGQGSINSSIQWSSNSGNNDWERLQLALGMNYRF